MALLPIQSIVDLSLHCYLRPSLVSLDFVHYLDVMLMAEFVQLNPFIKARFFGEWLALENVVGKLLLAFCLLDLGFGWKFGFGLSCKFSFGLNFDCSLDFSLDFMFDL
jgi:hypothetical protein